MVAQMDNSIEKSDYSILQIRFYTEQTFILVINLLLTLLNWQWPKAKIWFAYACYQLKRVLFVINEVYPRNAEPLPFHFVNHNYNASFQFTLERFEYPHEPSKRSRFPSEVITIFRFRNPSPRSLVVIRTTMICNEIVIVL